jgi:hypothetical protein
MFDQFSTLLKTRNCDCVEYIGISRCRATFWTGRRNKKSVIDRLKNNGENYKTIPEKCIVDIFARLICRMKTKHTGMLLKSGKKN